MLYSVTVHGVLLGHHIRREYSVSEIQDSSTLIMRLLVVKRSIIIRAYYYLSTRQRSELACIGTLRTLR